MQIVTAAVIRKDALILIAKRRPGGDLSGKWEFPGGKVEPGEDERTALARELREELAIESAIGGFIASARFEHAGRSYELRAFETVWTSGAMEPREHEELRWVAAADLRQFDFPDSDRAIVNALLDAPEARR